ncbi:MAG: hypothetical protein ABW104_12165 [Candidatus Thiodiazotropha sp. 6PLUC2]
MPNQGQTYETVEMIPNEVRELIVRKLRHHQHIQEKKWVSRAHTAYAMMSVNASTTLPPEQFSRAFARAALEAYLELTSHAENMAGEWPETVWEVMRSTLEFSNIQLTNGNEIKEILADFTDVKSDYQSLVSHIDPERFKKIVDRQAGRIGIIEKGFISEIHSMIDLKSKEARCGLLNRSKLKQEEFNIFIDEYVLKHRASNQENKDKTDVHNKKMHFECLPYPPKIKDDWFLAISDAVAMFLKNYNRCPTEAELWRTLKSSPLLSYEIESGKHHGEDAVFMGDKGLGKRSFSLRWKRYTEN